jgi:hypothetical protein
MNLIKLSAIAAALVLAACGSREWRSVQNNLGDTAIKANNRFSGFNAQDPSSLALLKSIGGASFRVTPETGEDRGVLTVVMKNCEQFSQEMQIKDGKEYANVSNSKNSGSANNSFETKCFGEGDSCDQVAVLFTRIEGGKRAQTVLSFKKNQYGLYNVNPVQFVGAVVAEADEFLSQRNERCEVVNKDKTILRSDEE